MMTRRIGITFFIDLVLGNSEAPQNFWQGVELWICLQNHVLFTDLKKIEASVYKWRFCQHKLSNYQLSQKKGFLCLRRLPLWPPLEFKSRRCLQILEKSQLHGFVLQLHMFLSFKMIEISQNRLSTSFLRKMEHDAYMNPENGIIFCVLCINKVFIILI